MNNILEKLGYIVGNKNGNTRLISNISNYVWFFLYFILSLVAYANADKPEILVASINVFYCMYLVSGYFVKRDKIIDDLKKQGRNRIYIPQIEDTIGKIYFILLLIVIIVFLSQFFNGIIFENEIISKGAFEIMGIIPLFISIMEETFNTIKRLYDAEIV